VFEMRFGNIKLPKRCMDVYDNPMKSMQLVHDERRFKRFRWSMATNKGLTKGSILL